MPVPDLDTTFDGAPAEAAALHGPRSAMVSNALLFSEEAILPDSFRHHRTPGLINPALTNVNRDFALIPARVMPHSITDRQLLPPRLRELRRTSVTSSRRSCHVCGAGSRPRRDCPDLQAIFRIRYPNERDPLLERRLFTAYGIDESAITWIAEPTWLESVYAATPMWHNAAPHYVHPDLQQIVAAGEQRPDPVGTPGRRRPPDRLFVSRRDTMGNRACRQRPTRSSASSETTASLSSIRRNWTLHSRHTCSGTRGSWRGSGAPGSSTSSTARALEHLIVLNHESYTARNEHLYAAVLGLHGALLLEPCRPRPTHQAAGALRPTTPAGSSTSSAMKALSGSLLRSF